MNRIWMVLMICLLSFSGIAQTTTKTSETKHKTTRHKAKKTVKKNTVLLSWAAAHNYDATAHVYFPDYYTYYDPQRGGYVYWDNGKWVFTPSVPPYMEHLDLNKERVQILKGLSLDLHPELDYPNYMKLYPATDRGNSMVPVPGDH